MGCTLALVLPLCPERDAEDNWHIRYPSGSPLNRDNDTSYDALLSNAMTFIWTGACNFSTQPACQYIGEGCYGCVLPHHVKYLQLAVTDFFRVGLVSAIPPNPSPKDHCTWGVGMVFADWPPSPPLGIRSNHLQTQ